MSDRCEPPEGAEFGSEHFIELDGKEVIAGWSPVDRLWTPARASSFHCDSPYAHLHGLRYLAPVTPPAEVARLRADLARLVEAGEAMQRCINTVRWRDSSGLRLNPTVPAYEHFTAALAAIKERPAAPPEEPTP